MPLTFAHPVVTLPLRRWLPFAAMAMGAMAPDFLYFFPQPHGVSMKYGHTWPGVLTFSIPAGMAMWLLWKALLRDAVISLLPTGEQQKLIADDPGFAWTSWRAWLLIVLAVAIGVFSHVALDSFSHKEGWGVEHVSFLTAVPVKMSHRELTVYKLIQYFGSIVGVGVLAIAYAFWSMRATRDASFRPAFRARARLLLVLVVGALSAYVGYRFALVEDGWALRIGSAIIGATRAAFLAALAIGVYVKVAAALRQTKPAEVQLSR